MFNAINEVFRALFFSEYGSIIGIILFVILCSALVMFRAELVFIVFLLSTLLGIEYFSYLATRPSFVWNIIILFAFTIVNVVFFAQYMEKGGKR